MIRQNNYFRYYFEAIGSGFEIELVGCDDQPAFLCKQFEMEVRDFERKYSRFLAGSEVWELNKNAEIGRSMRVSDGLWEILISSENYREKSLGYFNIGIESYLANLGYGAEKCLTLPREFKCEFVREREVKLNASIDLGGIGKGILLDKAKIFFEAVKPGVCVNAGGDIYARGIDWEGKPWRFFFENPFDLEEYFGFVDTDNELFLASSNSSKRRWSNGHHLVDPVAEILAENMGAVYVQGMKGELVDVFSTVLFVMGYEKAKEYLKNFNQVEAMLLSRDGAIYKTPKFQGVLMKS